MTLLVVAFLAGVLTVLAPCVLPLLPVVLGTSAAGRSRLTPYVVVGSLALSIIAFTYLLKASTAFIMVPQEFWTYLSGGILTVVGIVLVFPSLWERLPGIGKLSVSSNRVLGAGWKKHSFWGDALVGASLGPIFSTCSPTYFVILASVLPVSLALGTLYLLAYVVGLSIVLLLVAFIGQRFANKLSFIADSRSRFKRGVGFLFIVLGLVIALGYEKKVEIALLDNGFDITKIEQRLLERLDDDSVPGRTSTSLGTPYQELMDPSGFVNSEGVTLGELVGSKVILVDFMTYSCINCQRTFPYLNVWYETYKDDGLVIIGVHTPEFAFEKDIGNVEAAMEEFGIEYPVVLDNEYATWRAYGNRYWPRKYLIDIHGNIVYDHIGEGAYEETEVKIRELLEERAKVLGESGLETGELAASAIPESERNAKSPETYFGSERNEFLGNGKPKQSGMYPFKLPSEPAPNQLYLGGDWNIAPEYAVPQGSEGTVLYRFNAKQVHVVAESGTPTVMEVWQDGSLLNQIEIATSTLYTLVENEESGEHILELKVPAGVHLFAFTFG